MARYKVLAECYINDNLALAGEEVEYSGLVRKGIDVHLELIPGRDNAVKAKDDAIEVEAADRAAAIAAKLTVDGKEGSPPIGSDTPIDVVRTQLATFKQANAFN